MSATSPTIGLIPGSAEAFGVIGLRAPGEPVDGVVGCQCPCDRETDASGRTGDKDAPAAHAEIVPKSDDGVRRFLFPGAPEYVPISFET